VHNTVTINISPADSEGAEHYFFYASKTYNGGFLGVFGGALDFFDI